jgi:hypothetical protein
MPEIFTYPPSGRAEIANSVSPRRNASSTGPKPTLNRSTRIPNRFAAR